MATWAEFSAARPEMAEAGRTLLFQHGPGLAYLATVRKDGGPRIHPICPVIADGDLYAFIGRSPKLHDLLRDGRYALHTFPCADRDDEFFIVGRATLVSDREQVVRADTVYRAQGTTHGDEDRLFRLAIERVLHSAYQPRDGGSTWPPAYARWRAP
ncbi:MAG: pyridoxamine 5'-phosphate oxidase family protein [Dehalococcoidia bacterium]